MTALFAVSRGAEAAIFAKFPVNFPVSRESKRSRVPTALGRQPSGPVSRFGVVEVQISPQIRPFQPGWWSLSVADLPNIPDFDEKSLAFTYEIPVLRSHKVETG